jgi:hypothetical protein
MKSGAHNLAAGQNGDTDCALGRPRCNSTQSGLGIVPDSGQIDQGCKRRFLLVDNWLMVRYWPSFG